MALVTKITGAGKDFTLYEQPVSGLSTSVYRHEDAAIAPIFRPTITFRGSANSTKTNNTMSIDVKMPIVQTDSTTGQKSAPNKVQLKVTYTSLQGVVATELADTVDIAIAALTALKLNLVNGKVN